MNEQPNNRHLTRERKIVAWTWAKRQIEKSGPSRNGADACKLIEQQIRSEADALDKADQQMVSPP